MNLMAWYKLNGDATDASGNGRHGAASNVSWTAGKVGGAASFNGSSSFIDCGAIAPGGAATYAAWLWSNATAVRWPFGQRGMTAGCCHLYLLAPSGGAAQLQFYRWTGVGNAYQFWTSPINIPVGQWAHAAVVYNGTSTLTFVINGVAATAFAGSGNTTPETHNLMLGRLGGGSLWAGLLDDFRLYDEALPAWQIAAIYNFGRGAEHLEHVTH